MKNRHQITIVSKIGLPSISFWAILHPSYLEISRKQYRRIPKEGGYVMRARNPYPLSGEDRFLPVLVRD
jgi:hypothetical protein